MELHTFSSLTEEFLKEYLKTEEYVLDRLVDPTKKKTALADANAADSTQNGTDTLVKSKVKPKEVVEYEKKNTKKKIKVRDGITGVP